MDDGADVSVIPPKHEPLQRNFINALMGIGSGPPEAGKTHIFPTAYSTSSMSSMHSISLALSVDFKEWESKGLHFNHQELQNTRYFNYFKKTWPDEAFKDISGKNNVQ